MNREVKLLRPSETCTYMHQWTGSSLVQVMACSLYKAKPLSKPMLIYSKMDPQGQISVRFESKLKMVSTKSLWFCLGHNSLTPGSCGRNLKWVIFKVISSTDIFSTSSERGETVLMCHIEVNWWWVNLSPGHGLVSSGNKPLPESILTKISDARQHHRASKG